MILSKPPAGNTTVFMFAALDHQPVHTLFVLLSVTPKQHLELLARLAFLFRHQEFIALLRQRSEPKTIVEWIGNHLPK